VASFLAGLAALVAVVNVFYGMVLAWGVSGGDGETSVLRGLLAVGLFGSLVWAAVVDFLLLTPWQRGVVVGGVVLAGVIGMFFIATEDSRRRLRLSAGMALVGIATAFVVALIDEISPPGWRAVLIGLIPTLLFALAAVVAREDLSEGDGTDLLFVFGVLLAPSALLAIAVLTS
jgi:hypothetical protein